jgi:hypothetical protein
MTLDSRDSSGWFTSHSWLVGWLSATTMCSSSLIYLLDLWEPMEEVTRGLVNCQFPSGLSPGLEWKWWELVNRPLPWTYPWGASIPTLWLNTTLSFCCNRKLVPYEIQLW